MNESRMEIDSQTFVFAMKPFQGHRVIKCFHSLACPTQAVSFVALKLHYNLICPGGYSNILCFVSVIMFSHIAKASGSFPKLSVFAELTMKTIRRGGNLRKMPQNIYVHCDITIIPMLSQIMIFSQIFLLMFSESLKIIN
jgi:hypothetical protein